MIKVGFTEATFLFIFLPLTIITYHLVGQFSNIQVKNFVILAFSVSFYTWSSLDTLALFLVLCALIYLIGLLSYHLHKRSGPKHLPLVLLCIVLLIPLCYFKYTAFVVDTIGAFTSSDYSFIDILIPIGISFVTFEGISYVVDIYRGAYKAR